MNHILYYHQKLPVIDKYHHYSSVWCYKRGSTRDKQHYFNTAINDALEKQCMLCTVLKLIDM